MTCVLQPAACGLAMPIMYFDFGVVRPTDSDQFDENTLNQQRPVETGSGSASRVANLQRPARCQQRMIRKGGIESVWRHERATFRPTHAP